MAKPQPKSRVLKDRTVMLVKPWGEGQGDHVRIERWQYDPKVHTLLNTESAPPETGSGAPVPEPVAYAKLKVEELKALCAEREITPPEGAKKADLVKLLERSDRVIAANGGPDGSGA